MLIYILFFFKYIVSLRALRGISWRRPALARRQSVTWTSTRSRRSPCGARTRSSKGATASLSEFLNRFSMKLQEISRNFKKKSIKLTKIPCVFQWFWEILRGTLPLTPWECRLPSTQTPLCKCFLSSWGWWSLAGFGAGVTLRSDPQALFRSSSCHKEL